MKIKKKKDLENKYRIIENRLVLHFYTLLFFYLEA